MLAKVATLQWRISSSLTFVIGLSIGSLLSFTTYNGCFLSSKRLDASSAISVPHMSTASRTPNRKVDSLLEEKTLSSTRNTVFLTTTTFPDLFWDNKSRFKTAMEALRVERLSTLYKQCQMSVENFHGFSDKPNPWALHSKQYKYSVCDIQKCGSTSWLAFTLVAESMYTFADYKSRRITGQRVFDLADKRLRLGSFRYKFAAGKKWAESLRILTVRDPFARLVSAYKSKLRPDTIGFTEFYGNISKRISEQYRHMRRKNSTEKAKSDDGLATFEDFINFLLHSNESAVHDYHWATYKEICHPCWFKYNFIAKFETLKEDMLYLEHVLNLTETHRQIFFKQSGFNTHSDVVREHFAKVPCDISRKLYEKYKEDFEVFGYSRPEWIC